MSSFDTLERGLPPCRRYLPGETCTQPADSCKFTLYILLVSLSRLIPLIPAATHKFSPSQGEVRRSSLALHVDRDLGPLMTKAHWCPQLLLQLPKDSLALLDTNTISKSAALV
jgi:hypothetical protein